MSKITYPDKVKGDNFKGTEATEVKNIVNENDDKAAYKDEANTFDELQTFNGSNNGGFKSISGTSNARLSPSGLRVENSSTNAFGNSDIDKLSYGDGGGQTVNIVPQLYRSGGLIYFPAADGTLAAIGTTAPSSASDTGAVGEIRVTATFIYHCIAVDTWVRSAAATW